MMVQGFHWTIALFMRSILKSNIKAVYSSKYSNPLSSLTKLSNNGNKSDLN